MGLLQILGIGKYLKKVKEYTDQQIENLVGSAPETLNTLQELSDALKNDAGIVDALNNAILTKADKTTVESIPVVMGDMPNSAVLKGEYQGYKNKAISQTSVAIGAATTAGLKGWYYSKIEFGSTPIITLSDKQPSVFLGYLSGGSWTSGTPNIKVGDKISIVNNAKYDYCGEVKSISGNKITLKSALPFDSLDTGLISVNNPDDWSIYLPDNESAGIIDFGGGALAEGVNTKSTNIGSHAEGIQTHAYGQYSHTEGFKTEAGYAAHAEGRGTKADGEESHAEGLNTTASGKHSHAEGDITEATGVNAHAEGYLSKASGNSSHAEGGNWAKGATGDARINGGTAEGAGSHAEGGKTTAIADYSHAEGYRSVSSGPNSHSEGQLTRTGGEDADRPTGNPGTASGQNAHAEGAVTFAQGAGSHAEGGNTWASGNYSHAEGWQTRTHPTANNSHAEGFYTEVYNRGEHASGQYNVSVKSSDKSKATQFSIGIGTSKDDRKNGFEVKQNGDIYIEGLSVNLLYYIKSLESRIKELEDIIKDITITEK
jgi:hypothetical protein